MRVLRFGEERTDRRRSALAAGDHLGYIKVVAPDALVGVDYVEFREHPYGRAGIFRPDTAELRGAAAAPNVAGAVNAAQCANVAIVANNQ